MVVKMKAVFFESFLPGVFCLGNWILLLMCLGLLYLGYSLEGKRFILWPVLSVISVGMGLLVAATFVFGVAGRMPRFLGGLFVVFCLGRVTSAVLVGVSNVLPCAKGKVFVVSIFLCRSPAV